MGLEQADKYNYVIYVEIFSISLISDKGLPEAVVRWNTSQMSFRIKANPEFLIIYFFIISSQNLKGKYSYKTLRFQLNKLWYLH